MADAIMNNQTRQAAYCTSEKIFVNYGIYVITSIDAGAILMKED